MPISDLASVVDVKNGCEHDGKLADASAVNRSLQC